jgi:hypothetical protein
MKREWRRTALSQAPDDEDIGRLHGTHVKRGKADSGFE